MKKWNKRIGESIKAGEMLCEVALNDFSVAIDASHGGVLAQIIVPAGSSIAAEQPIAAYARTMEEYFTYLDETRTAASDAIMGAALEELLAEHSQHPTAAVLMRTIRQLIKSGHINPSTGTVTLRTTAGLMQVKHVASATCGFNRLLLALEGLLTACITSLSYLRH